MDIAKMVEISERSVTRLLTKSKEFQLHEYSLDILDDVERLLSNYNVVFDAEALVDTKKEEEKDSSEDCTGSFSQNYISKSRIGLDLIRMKVKVLKTKSFNFNRRC